MKPFKTVKIEYFNEVSTSQYGPPPPERRIKVVTTTEHWIGSSKDPIITTKFEYL